MQECRSLELIKQRQRYINMDDKRIKYLIEKREESLELKKEEYRNYVSRINVGDIIKSEDLANTSEHLCRLAIAMGKLEGIIEELRYAL